MAALKTLIVGCGYVGMAVGQSLVERGDTVTGICRSAESADAVRAAGMRPWIADITSLDSLRSAKPEFDAIINCVSSSRGGEQAYREVYLKGTINLLEWTRPSPPQIIVYTGSTTVYAQSGGEWVDETSPTEPPHASGRILVETEKLYLDSRLPVTVLRLAGIYGPGRHAMLDRLRGGGTDLAGDGKHFVNMIHRDDIVATLLATLDRKLAGEILNVVDDEPVQQVEYVGWLCEQLGLPPAKFDPDAEKKFKGGMRKGFQPNRRIANEKMKSVLGVTLQYPNFREGLLPMIQDPKL
jgi:nucleoside-diphosphate-sugar epimerase